MLENINILFIDDTSLSEEIESIENLCRKNGIRVCIDSIKVNSHHFQVVQDGVERIKVLDPSKIKKSITEEYINKKYDIVACDFSFSDKNFNGFLLLSWLINLAKQKKYKIRNAKFIFYSGNVKELSAVAGGDIKKLISLKIEKLVDRSNLVSDVFKLITSIRDDIDFKKEFVNLFDQHENCKLKSGYPDFNQLTLGQIRDEIENETDHSVRFIKSLVNLTFAHLVDLQKAK